MTDRFAGQVGLVTGGSAGIGLATGRLLAEQGATIILVDVDEGAGERASTALRADGLAVTFSRADVSIEGEMEFVVDAIVDRHGRLDLAFNNAGVASVGVPVDQLTEETWQHTIAVNLTGVWRSLKAEARAMRDGARGGSIVNTASICGFQVAPLTSPYNATKHAVIGLTKEAAVDLAPQGIRVNCVCPGYTHTAMSHSTTTEADRARMAATVPLGRWADTDELARAVSFLLSAEASYITGHPLVVDGGTIVQVAGPQDERA